MARERLNPFRLNDIAGTGSNRTATLERLLKEERAALGAARPASGDHSIATANVALLERQIEQSKRNDAARDQIETEIAERRRVEDAATAERRQAAVDAETATIRQQYRAANPHATDAEIDTVLPGLVERHRQERADRLIAEMRSKYVA